MTRVERAASAIGARLAASNMKLTPTEIVMAADHAAQALSDAGMLADPDRIRRLEEVRDRLLVSGGANPAVGKIRFSTWSLRGLTAAFDCAAATLPTPPAEE